MLRTGFLVDSIFNSWPISTYGCVYDDAKYDLVLKGEYIQKEIEALKSKRKQYRDIIVEIEKEIDALEKRIE